LEQHRVEESLAIEELEIAMKQLKSAYAAVFNKFARIAKNPDLKISLTINEFDEIDQANSRLDAVRVHANKIVEEIRQGIRD